MKMGLKKTKKAYKKKVKIKLIIKKKTKIKKIKI